jgi:ubiquinone biosynthesis protein
MISSMRASWRLIQIGRVLARYRLEEITPLARLFAPLSWFRGLLGGDQKTIAGLTRGARVRHALQELGPIFVKFGQILSTRRDLLPADVADELAMLQDRVAPFPGALARAEIERSLGAPIDQLFAQFDESPLASASIAQVHAAKTFDGRDVVCKVLRPGITAQIDADTRLLRALADLADRRFSEAQRIRPKEIVAEIERTLRDELDLLREGANGSQFRRNFADSPDMYAPEMIWSLSRGSVLTMERIYGVPLSDLAELQRLGVDFHLLAEKAVRLFYLMVFRDNFFHADLHPGNLFVARENPATPKFIALDFGIMGQLPPDDLRYIAENFSAMFRKDYRRVAELHIEAGWVPSNVRVDDLEGAVRTVCEPYFTRPLSEISLGEVLMKLFQVARRFQLIIQPQLLLMQKTLLNVEGIGRTLSPKLDLWAVAKPVLEDIMRKRYGMQAAVDELKLRVPGWVQNAPEIPRLLHAYLRSASSGQQHLQMSSDDLKALVMATRDAHARTMRTILGSCLLIIATLVWTLHPHPLIWRGVPVAASIAALGAVWLFIAAWKK